MDNKVNYTIIGVIGFLLVAAFIFMVFWMTSFKHSRQFDTYMTYFDQEVTGLQKQSGVRFNGIKVGYITDIKFDPDNLQKVEIFMHVDPKVPVTTSTVAIIESAGFTGGKYVALKALKSKAPLLKLKKGEKYIVIPSQESMIEDLESSLKKVSKEMQQTIASINQLVGPANRRSVNESLANVAKITNVIAKNSKKIDESLSSMQKILANTSTASKEFPAMVKQARETLASFEDTADKLNQTGAKVNVAVGRTSTAIQNVSDQLLPSAEQLLAQINQMMSSFRTLSSELAQNPSILIRGKAPGPMGPGEYELKGDQR